MNAQQVGAGLIRNDDATQVNSKVRLKASLRRVVMILRAIAREVFDEAAYQRYLDRTGCERSKESYRSFSRERQILLASKFRCC